VTDASGGSVIYSDGLVTATTPPVASWERRGKAPDVDDFLSELHDLAEDFGQAVNLTE
jgi:hypothetical protein